MANNFGSDGNCKALWKLDNGALTIDSKGTNTLTNINTVASNTTTKKEGDGSAYYASALSNKCLSIADASLDSGFPLKAGNTTKTMSFSFWYYPTSNATGDKVIIGKWASGGYCLALDHVGSTLSVGWAKSASSQDWTFGSLFTFVLNTYYHISVRIDGDAKTCNIRVFDENTKTVRNYTHTYADSLYITGVSPLTIGGLNGSSQSIGGYIDEVVVHSRVLSDDDVDQIRMGIYPGDITYQLDIAPHNMTASALPTPYAASASSEDSSGYAAWKAFENYSSNFWKASSGNTTGWLKIDTGIINTITSYAVQANNVSADLTSTPKSWTLQGSNDNSNWTTLDTQSNQIDWYGSQIRQYTLSNAVSYRYFMISVTENNGGASLVVAELFLFVAALAASKSVAYAVLTPIENALNVSKSVAYAVIEPISPALNVSKAVAYAVLGPYVEPQTGSGPMIWIF